MLSLKCLLASLARTIIECLHPVSNNIVCFGYYKAPLFLLSRSPKNIITRLLKDLKNKKFDNQTETFIGIFMVGNQIFRDVCWLSFRGRRLRPSSSIVAGARADWVQGDCARSGSGTCEPLAAPPRLPHYPSVSPNRVARMDCTLHCNASLICY